MNELTIEELFQKASPTPWTFLDKWTDADKDAMGEKEAKALRKIIANRQIADHCVNNFMQLLEALEIQNLKQTMIAMMSWNSVSKLVERH